MQFPSALQGCLESFRAHNLSFQSMTAPLLLLSAAGNFTCAYNLFHHLYVAKNVNYCCFVLGKRNCKAAVYKLNQ